MSNDLMQTAFDYGLLDERTRVRLQVRAESIRSRLKRTAEDIVAIGQDLIEAKKDLGHGQFIPWLKAEFEMSESAATKFMQVAHRFGEGTKSVKFTDLSASVLYELAAPSTSDEVIKKVESGEVATLAQEKEITLLEAVRLTKRAEEAEEKARKEEEARLAAETRAENAETQLSLFQADQPQIDQLTQQIETLQQEMLTLSTPEIQEIEVEKIVEKTIEVPVISEEAQKKIEDLQTETDRLIEERNQLEADRDNKTKDLELLTQERDDLTKEKEGLVKLANDNLFAETQAKYDSEVKDANRKMSAAFSKGLHNTLSFLPTSIDAKQAYSSDEWARIAQMRSHAVRFIEELDKLKDEVTSQFVDVESPKYIEAPAVYIEG